MQSICIYLSFMLLISMQGCYARNSVVFASNYNLRSFYGIPTNLTVSDLKRLPYRVKVRRQSAAEGGDSYTAANITAKDGVEVDVHFDSKGKLYEIDTESPKAVDPKGIKIGSLLSAVRRAYPNGRLIFGYEENIAFVTFNTGTNVAFSFDPKDMPRELIFDHRKDIEIPDITVRGIHITAKAFPVSDTCLPGYCL